MALYSVEEWRVGEDALNAENSFRSETIFALSNGFVGTRGTLEELPPPDGLGLEGNFINGFYESEPIRYGEKGYAFPDVSQTMLNVPNGKVVELAVDGVPLTLTMEQIEEHHRALLLDRGCTCRTTIYKLKDGRRIRVEATRFASMTRKNLLCCRYRVTPLNFSGKITVTRLVDGDVRNSTEKTNARIDYGPYGQVMRETARRFFRNGCLLEHEVNRTKFHLVTGLAVQADMSASCEPVERPAAVGSALLFNVSCGQPVCLDSWVCYAASTDTPEENLQELTLSCLEKACKDGWDTLEQEQAAYYAAFWKRADIRIQGDDRLQQGIRFDLFHLLQGAGRDGKTNIGAKCLTGEGYEGHAFWDTEMYALPFFLYNDPTVARSFIQFRYRTLDQARERARQMDCEGALFPWRTINGQEASPYFPAGTAQYHINADVAYAVYQYWKMTGDDGMLRTMGAEILLETARFWLSFGVFSEYRGGAFCLNCVTGPDEFTALVNNNCYTNLMAQANLRAAVEAAETLQKDYPRDWQALCCRCHFREEELADFARAADRMYIPYDEEHGIYWQDDSFAQKKPLDIPGLPPEKRPIADHMHFLTLYRLQVLKQADTLLAMMVLSERFDEATVRLNYDFYEPKTIHESSLSQCVHSILASRIGYHEKAYDFFADSARLDLDDVQGNTSAGIHMANLAGAWMCITYGFGGMRPYKGTVQVAPWLPENWQGYSFHISLRGSVILVEVDHTGTRLTLQSGKPISVYLYDTCVEVR